MDKFTKLTGVAAPLNMINIDTDMIIPKQLKTIKRSGLENIFSMKCVLTVMVQRSRALSCLQHTARHQFWLREITLAAVHHVSMRLGRYWTLVSNV